MIPGNNIIVYIELLTNINFLSGLHFFTFTHKPRCSPFWAAERARLPETELFRAFPPERRRFLLVETWLVLQYYVCFVYKVSLYQVPAQLISAQQRTAALA